MKLFKRALLCWFFSIMFVGGNDFSVHRIFKEKPELIIYHTPVLTSVHLKAIDLDFSTGKDVILTLNKKGVELLSQELKKNKKHLFLMTVGGNLTAANIVPSIKGDKFKVHIGGDIQSNIENIRSISKKIKMNPQRGVREGSREGSDAALKSSDILD